MKRIPSFIIHDLTKSDIVAKFHTALPYNKSWSFTDFKKQGAKSAVSKKTTNSNNNLKEEKVLPKKDKNSLFLYNRKPLINNCNNNPDYFDTDLIDLNPIEDPFYENEVEQRSEMHNINYAELNKKNNYFSDRFSKGNIPSLSIKSQEPLIENSKKMLTKPFKNQLEKSQFRHSSTFAMKTIRSNIPVLQFWRNFCSSSSQNSNPPKSKSQHVTYSPNYRKPQQSGSRRPTLEITSRKPNKKKSQKSFQSSDYRESLPSSHSINSDQEKPNIFLLHNPDSIAKLEAPLANLFVVRRHYNKFSKSDKKDTLMKIDDVTTRHKSTNSKNGKNDQCDEDPCKRYSLDQDLPSRFYYFPKKKKKKHPTCNYKGPDCQEKLLAKMQKDRGCCKNPNEVGECCPEPKPAKKCCPEKPKCPERQDCCPKATVIRPVRKCCPEKPKCCPEEPECCPPPRPKPVLKKCCPEKPDCCPKPCRQDCETD